MTSVDAASGGTVSIAGGQITFAPDLNLCAAGAGGSRLPGLRRSTAADTATVTVTSPVSTTRRSRSTTPPPWMRTRGDHDATCWPTTPTSTATRSDHLGHPAGQRHRGDHRGGDRLTYSRTPTTATTRPGDRPDTFTYTAQRRCRPRPSSVTVTCVDDAPIAVDDTATVAEDDRGHGDRRAGQRHRRRRRPDQDRLGHPAGQRHRGDHRRRHRADLPAGPELLQRPAPAPTPDTFTYTLNGG